MTSIAIYNILQPQNPSDHANAIGLTNGKSNWEKRKEIIASNITSSGIDILCLSEVPRSGIDYFKKSLLESGYELIWIPHEDKGKSWDQGVAIAYKKEHYQLTASKIGQFKDSIITHHSGDQKIRRHLIAEFQDVKTQQFLRIAAVHLNCMRQISHFSQRANHIKTIMTDLESTSLSSNSIENYVIAGDFNQDQYGDREEGDRKKSKDNPSTTHKALEDKGYKFDGNLNNTVVAVHHKDPNKLFSKERHIDWIFVKTKNKLTHLDLPNFDQWGSDHVMVATAIGDVDTSKIGTNQHREFKKLERTSRCCYGGEIFLNFLELISNICFLFADIFCQNNRSHHHSRRRH